MKKKLLILLIMLLFPIAVFAESKDIIVKYKKTTNGITYIDKIENSNSQIIIGNKTIIISVYNSLNGKEVALIKVQGDAYEWLSAINGENTYYYLGIIDDDEMLETSKIKSISIDGSTIKIYDSTGKNVKTDNEKVDYSKSNIYFSYEDIKEEEVKEATLTINGKGRVMVNEKIYEESGTIEIDEHSKIMIMAAQDYEFKEAYLNDSSIYSDFKDNTLSYDLKKDDKLEITFAEKVGGSSDETSEFVNISGYAKKDDKPLQNVQIILRGNKEYIARTDNSGYYEFSNVPFGEYEMLIISDDNKNVAYKKFSINKTGTGDVSLEDGVPADVNINVDDNYDLSFNVSNNQSPEVEKSTNYVPIIVFASIIIVALIVIILLLTRKKKEEKM